MFSFGCVLGHPTGRSAPTYESLGGRWNGKTGQGLEIYMVRD